MDPQYSGSRSVEFWARVRKLKQPHYGDLYLMGCALQDWEGRVLQLLRHYEQQAVAKGGRSRLRPQQTKVRSAGKQKPTSRSKPVVRGAVRRDT